MHRDIIYIFVCVCVCMCEINECSGLFIMGSLRRTNYMKRCVFFSCVGENIIWEMSFGNTDANMTMHGQRIQ